ncbi:hypothetical protein Tco_1262067 [Tanacetum coccineum]
MNEDYCEQNSFYYPNSSGFDHPQPPQDSVDHQGILQILNKLEEKFEEIIRDGRKKIEDMSIEEMMHEQQLVDREIKEIINDLGIKRFRGEEIDEEYERDYEKYAAACRYMLSVTCDDEDDYIPLAITPDLPIEEPDNSLNMGDEHLDTIPATESDEFEGISDDTSDVPTCDNNRVNVESDLVESLINRDTLIVHSSKIDPILEEFAGELAHIAPIPPGIVEADFDPNDDTSSDDDSFENIEYVDASPSYIEYDSFKEIEPDQEGLISIDNSNEPLLELPEFETDAPVINNFDELNEDECFDPGGDEIDVEDDDSFKFVIRTFLPFLTYPVDSLFLCSFGNEDTIFDPDIST